MKNYTLPSNSETLNVDETSARFSGATWYEHIQTKKVAFSWFGRNWFLGSFNACKS